MAKRKDKAIADDDKTMGVAADETEERSEETAPDGVDGSEETASGELAADELPEATEEAYTDGGLKKPGKIRLRTLKHYGYLPPGSLIYMPEDVGRGMIKDGTCEAVE